MVYATPIKFPAPIGRVQADDAAQEAQRLAEHLLTAASSAAVTPEGEYLVARDERMQRYCADAYERILRAQTSNMDQRRSRPSRGGKQPLRTGDLAYLLVPRGRGREVRGPYVVAELHDTGHVTLRTTRQVRGQDVKYYRVPIDQVARCTTAVDALADLLEADKQEIEPYMTSSDAMALWHVEGSAAQRPSPV